MNQGLLGAVVSTLLSAAAAAYGNEPLEGRRHTAPELPASELSAGDRFDGIRAAIREFIGETDVPSVAVAVARDGEIVWEGAFGWASREDSIPATVHAMYPIASTSKPMTATGVMLLVERGEIGLDRPVNDYLGGMKLVGLAGDAGGATIRRVLAHTAGLPSYAEFFYADTKDRPASRDETIARYGILVAPPGERYIYSNLGYAILDDIIARVSGLSYGEFMRREVFLPLGMSHSSVGADSSLGVPVATAYDRDRRPLPHYVTGHCGASGIYSSVHDLVRFGMSHMQAEVDKQTELEGETGELLQGWRSPVSPLQDSTIGLMQASHAPESSVRLQLGAASSGYGLGWDIGSSRGHRRIGHSGWMPGVMSLLSLYPREKVAVGILANARVWPDRIIEEIEEVMMPPGSDRSGDQRPGGFGRGLGPDGGSLPSDRLPVDLLGVWAGSLRTWMGSMPLTLTVHPGGSLSARMGDRGDARVSELSWQQGLLTGKFAGVIPTDDALRHDHFVVLELRREGDAMHGQVSAFTGWAPRYYFLLPSYAVVSKRAGDHSRSHEDRDGHRH